jgi:signal transduction histidine kinase
VAALEFLVFESQKNCAARIELTSEVRFTRLGTLLENALYRIVQESLTNACRYSQSPRIEIRLSRTDSRVLLDVRDWGVGFDPAAVGKSRFGLRGIRDRARLLDGEATITSAPGSGTHIHVELPQADEDGLGDGDE